MPRMSGKAILASLPYVVENQFEELKYRVYVTDALYSVSNGALKKRYYDIMKKPQKAFESVRTGDEIASDLMKEMGLTYEPV